MVKILLNRTPTGRQRLVPSVRPLSLQGITRYPPLHPNTDVCGKVPVAMDILGPLPKTSRQNRYIGSLRSVTTLLNGAKPSLCETWKPPLWQEILLTNFGRSGMPDCLHSDQGRNVESNVAREMCSLLGITKTQTTSTTPSQTAWWTN